MELLQEWANRNAPKDDLKYKDSFWNQIIFVRDKLGGILAKTYEEYKNLVKVASNHTSKSVLCPVYYMEIAEGVKVWMRYNFHNWNISIESPIPITCNFLGLFNDKNYGYCYCEGMTEFKFDEYKNNNKKFTVCIDNHYDCYAFFWILRTHLGIKYT